MSSSSSCYVSHLRRSCIMNQIRRWIFSTPLSQFFWNHSVPPSEIVSFHSMRINHVNSASILVQNRLRPTNDHPYSIIIRRYGYTQLNSLNLAPTLNNVPRASELISNLMSVSYNWWFYLSWSWSIWFFCERIFWEGYISWDAWTQCIISPPPRIWSIHHLDTRVFSPLGKINSLDIIRLNLIMFGLTCPLRQACEFAFCFLCIVYLFAFLTLFIMIQRHLLYWALLVIVIYRLLFDNYSQFL